MKLWNYYLRWRHFKGFGVHSPYAYSFVINVLHPGPYSFYSYNEIEKHLDEREKNDTKLIKSIKFTIRLAVFLKTKRIVYSVSQELSSKIAAKSLKLPSKSIDRNEKFSFLPGDLLVAGKSDLTDHSIEAAIRAKVPVYAVKPNKELKQFLELPLEKGLLLKGKNRIILIPRDEMNYVTYDIMFDGKL